MKRPVPPRRQGARGFLLLEVLVAVLIFAIGVLALVGLQAASIRQSGDAKFRADATLLANDLIGRMWVADRTFASLSANFATGGAGFNQWLANARTTLPGVDVENTTVTINPVAAGGPASAAPGLPSSLVTVVLSWRPPNEPATVHNVTVVTQIK